MRGLNSCKKRPILLLLDSFNLFSAPSKITNRDSRLVEN